ncbi:MAG: twin transmembrane helix small protein [Gammaproteobacteria bacterium]
MQIAVPLILLGIVGSLASALFFLVRDKQDSKRTVRALTVRVGLSVSLFVLLLVAYSMGLVQPRPLG